MGRVGRRAREREGECTPSTRRSHSPSVASLTISPPGRSRIRRISGSRSAARRVASAGGSAPSEEPPSSAVVSAASQISIWLGLV